MTYIFEDLIKQKFGRLVILNVVGKTKDGDKLYECLCDCGNHTTVPGGSLMKKKRSVKSCGCLRKETLHAKKENNPENVSINSLFSSYRYRGKARDQTFELTKDQFKDLTSKNCHYCSNKPLQKYCKHPTDRPYVYNGIDRIDPSKGYSIENCVTCCWLCNRAKGDMSYSEFMSWIKKVYNNMVLSGDIE
jgi:5-methylcytosine-specific restriction endonuclease McrA